MSEPKWTVEQLAAIEQQGQLLVAAAAGSGKTAVLVERLIRRILDPKTGIDVDQFLVLTFTKAAANEMRERIGKALEAALFKETDSAEVEHLLHQRALLSRASITTIHSFCMELIRQNFYRLELDPAFRVADQAEADLLRQDVLEDLFETLYDQENPSFQDLVEAFGSDRDDQPLMENVLRLYEFATSQVDPINWLERLARAYHWQSVDELTQSPWGESVRQSVKDKVEESIGLLERAQQLSLQPGGPLHYSSCLLEDLDRLKHLSKVLQEGSWGEIEVQFKASVKFPKLPSGPRLSFSEEDQKIFREEAKKPRDEAKKKLEKLNKDLFQFPLEEQLPWLDKMGELVKTLVTVVQEFAQRFAHAKRQRNIVDFSDLEHFALKLLGETSNEDTLTTLAEVLQQRFAEVMVDEYQDINPVQERILQLVSRQGGLSPNLFMVGDVKQSIYRFRMADPSLFLAKYMSLPHWNPEQETSQDQKLVIDLNRNFRSRKEVIDGVNFIFRQIMTEGAGEIPYDDQAALCYGANYVNGCSGLKTAEGPIEVHLFDPKTLKQSSPLPASETANEDDSAQQDIDQGISENGETNEDKGSSQEEATLEDLENARLEARLVGDRIQQIVQGREFQVFDKNLQDFRAVQYSDVVILMRSFSAIAPLFVEEFQALGIPVYAETSSGYFGASEVETMLSLLKIIDNPRLDIPLAAVLRSPFVDMNGTELGRMRALLPQGDFYEAFVLAYWAAQKLEEEKQNEPKVQERLEWQEVFVDHEQQVDQVQQEQQEEHEGCEQQDQGDSDQIPDVLKDYEKSWSQLLTQACKILQETPTLQEKVLYFYPKLQAYRQLARQTSLADLLWFLYEDTGYLAYVGTLPSGPQRQANLRALYDRACHFEATNYRGLFRFLRFLDRFQGQGKDLGSARALGENEDVVRLITVHASKGLEFPVVFFVGLGKKFNTRSLSGNLLLHSSLGVGIPLFDIKNRVRYPSFIQTGIKERLWQESLAEELRILYVALTRAKERLFLYGAISKLPEVIKQWQSLAAYTASAFSDGQLRSARSFLDWIGPAIARHPQNLFDESAKPELLDSSSRWTVQLHDHLENSITETEKQDGAVDDELTSKNELEINQDHSLEEWVQLINERLNWQYGYPEAVHQAAKTSVSELKRRFAYYHDELISPFNAEENKRTSEGYTRPKFLQTHHKLTPAERGTAFHAVMEHLPLKDWSNDWFTFLKDEQKSQVEALLQSLLDREILTAEQIEALSVTQITNFINSPAGTRMLTSREVRREVPFTLTLFPDSDTSEEYLEKGGERGGGVLIQGVIDVLILSPDQKEAEILDYKTDQVKSLDAPEKELIKRYALQLAIYSLAVERLLHVRIEQATIYSVDLNTEIAIPLTEIQAKQKMLNPIK